MAVRGYTIEDAQRLKEAGVLMVEGKAGEQIGKARKLDAEAAKLYAETEEIYQENAIKELQQKKDGLDLEEKRVALLERQAAAMERLEKSISVIKMKGGAAFVDGTQIDQALRANGQLLGAGSEEIEEEK